MMRVFLRESTTLWYLQNEMRAIANTQTATPRTTITPTNPNRSESLGTLWVFTAAVKYGVVKYSKHLLVSDWPNTQISYNEKSTTMILFLSKSNDRKCMHILRLANCYTQADLTSAIISLSFTLEQNSHTCMWNLTMSEWVFYQVQVLKHTGDWLELVVLLFLGTQSMYIANFVEN